MRTTMPGVMGAQQRQPQPDVDGIVFLKGEAKPYSIVLIRMAIAIPEEHLAPFGFGEPVAATVNTDSACFRTCGIRLSV